MKKIFALCCLLGIGIFGGAVTSSAEAYVGDTDSIKIDPEANKKAIEILRDSGELEDTRFPLDKLTTDTPEQAKSTNLFASRGQFPKIYVPSETKLAYGIWQHRIPKLVPVGFNWLDNGIPTFVFDPVGTAPSYVTFNPGKVWDTGVGAYDQGYYWRNIGTPWGSFWASVWNVNNLIYG